jgi:hypothetical protein
MKNLEFHAFSASGDIMPRMVFQALAASRTHAAPALSDRSKPAGKEWPHVGGDWSNSRYSTLNQITRANIKDLKASVLALGAKTGTLIWERRCAAGGYGAMTYRSVKPRARLGFIVPASNRMVEPQMARFCPPGVVPHFMRIRMTTRYKRPLPELLPTIVNAAELLVDSRCDIVVFQCTGTFMSGGVDMDKHVVEEIGRHSAEALA